MIRIPIDKSLEAFAEEFSKNLFSNKDRRFKKPLNLLKDLLMESNNEGEKTIIALCIRYYSKLLILKPEQQQKLVKHIDTKRASLFYYVNNKATPFSEKLFKAFRYEELRSTEAHKIIEKLGIKTCVYCNAQLAVVVGNGRKRKAKLELDHFFPSSKYPFLSTSIFNLLPSCSQCNKAKTNSGFKLDTHFHLYTETNQLEPFQFSLCNASVVKYWLDRDINNLKIDFKDHNGESKVTEHDKVFSITDIYNTQKDVAEELLIKKEIYTESYQKEISEIKGLFDKKDQSLFNRIIVGNYLETKNVHKRPLAKFTQDIAKQLKLVKTK